MKEVEIKKANLGVIGVGAMGGGHANAISQLPNADLTAVADVIEAQAKQIASKFGARKCYTDYDKLLKDPDIDGVIIATPDQFHRDPAVAAAEAGKHILLEKPVATTLRDADAIIDAAKRNSVRLQIGYLLRFDPRYIAIKDMVESGQLGRVVHAYSRRSTAIQEGLRYQGRCTVENYLAVHDIDQILWYIKDDVVRVYSENIEGRVKEKTGVADFNWTMFKFKGGALAASESGWALPDNWGAWQHNWNKPTTWSGIWGDCYMQVIGTEGAVYYKHHPQTVTACDRDGWKFHDQVFGAYGTVSNALRDEDKHFADCIIEDKDPINTGEDGRKSLEIILAARKSYETEMPVKLPL